MSNNKSDPAWWNARFPFLRITNNSTCPWSTEEDSWIESIPVGWAESFFEDMCKELMFVLGDCVNDFEIAQLKEKYGEMRLYWEWKDIGRDYTPWEQQMHKDLMERIEEIINKYAIISAHTCVKCGKQSTHYTQPWILPLCDECDKYN